jgi:hypothetical protein
LLFRFLELHAFHKCFGIVDFLIAVLQKAEKQLKLMNRRLVVAGRGKLIDAASKVLVEKPRLAV